MTAIFSILSILGTGSLIVLFYVLAKLSERFGAVIKMPPIFRYYYIALIFLAIGAITQFIVAIATLTPKNTSSWLVSSWFLLLAYHLPLAIGLTTGLVITWRYWSWLVTEHNG